MAKINKDGSIDAPELTDSLERQADAQNEAAEATEANTKLKKADDKKEVGRRKRAEALGKATGKLKDKIEGAAKASEGVTGTLDVFSDIIGNKAVQKLTLLAGATGIAAAQTLKYGKALVSIQRTLPNFFSQGLGQALLDTGSLMAKTGLDIESLGTVIKKNGLAFRKHGEQIGEVTDKNEAFRIAMGLSRDTFVSLNARSILQEQTAAKGTLTTEQLTKRTRDYIIQLDELALQTGRSISEVEDSRIANSKGAAGFLATLDKQSAVLFQQGQKALERAGAGFATQITGLVSSSDVNENLKKISDFEVGLLQVARDAGISSEEEVTAQLHKLRIAQVEGDGESIKEVFEFLAKFGVNLNQSGKGLFKNTRPVNDAAIELGTNAAIMGKVVDETGKDIAEAGKAQVEGQRAQLAIIEAAIASTTEMGKLAIRLNKIFDAFGADISAAGLALGALGFAGALKGLTGRAGAIGLFGAALILLARWLEDRFAKKQAKAGARIEEKRGQAEEDLRKERAEIRALGLPKEEEKALLRQRRQARQNATANIKHSPEADRLLEMEKLILSKNPDSVEGKNLRRIRLAFEAADKSKTLDTSGSPTGGAKISPDSAVFRPAFGPPRAPTVTPTAPSTANARDLSIPQASPGQTVAESTPVNISQGEPDSAAKNQELAIRLADKGNLLLEELIRNTRGAGANALGNRVQKARQQG